MEQTGTKGNVEFTKDYTTCCLGKVKLKLGDWDDGDQYDFDLRIFFEGLFVDENDPKKLIFGKIINLKGSGHQELEVIAEMFKDISDVIKANL